ncbi:unnamed protein product [Rotaria sp. Silwood1]|nr:unnamed protein product [Rotaria sp. Silwood1]CAF1606448.1 unnamed protein product [Rotaria sp. Silwood1]CAF3687767.1 unnamed protein product [Rotaria sp. Silwood1]CAF3720892.1 unnamed protein product [Rotaria sp. Silwood1]CAF3725206.1 unnamed protein product [Rotaria sp. Silwood1]
MTNNNETQCDNNQSTVSSQTSTKILNQSNKIFVPIKGVRFINSHGIIFLEAHRAKYPHIQWSPPANLPQVKPSPSWFSSDYPWLRAIYSEDHYGLLCIDCVEFASNEMAVKKLKVHLS